MAINGSFTTSAYDGYYLVFSWEILSQSVVNNSTTISWKLTGVGKYNNTYYLTQNIKVVIDGETVYNFPRADGQIQLWNGTQVAIGTYTFTHNASGARSFTAYAEAGIYVWDVNCTGEGSWALKDIAQPSVLDAAGGTLGTAQTLTIVREDATLTHKLFYECGDIMNYIAGSSTSFTSQTSITWTPPLALAAQNTTGSSVPITLTLETYSEGVYIGRTRRSFNYSIPSSVKPSVSVAWEDITGVSSKYGSPVQRLSKLRISLSATIAQGSPIASYAVLIGGVKYSGETVTTEALLASGEINIVATVTDQRGRTGSASLVLDILEYTPPVISLLTTHRCNSDGAENAQGDFVRVTFSAAVTSLNGKNTAAYTLRYREGGKSGDNTVTFAALNNNYSVTEYSHIFAASGNSSYAIEVEATDNHNTATRATSASTAFTLINWHASGTGMAVGKISELENAVEFGLDLYDKNGNRIVGMDLNTIYPIGSIVIRYDHINPGTLFGGSWLRIIGAVPFGVDDGGNIGGTGMLAGGSNLAYINVSIWRRIM